MPLTTFALVIVLQAGKVAPPQPAPQPQPPHTDSMVVALNAQLGELRRSDDRLFTTVLWTLGTTITIALGLSAFSWWSSHRIYERDITAIKADIRAISEQASASLRVSLEVEASAAFVASRQELTQ